jgi:hypothetical protein
MGLPNCDTESFQMCGILLGMPSTTFDVLNALDTLSLRSNSCPTLDHIAGELLTDRFDVAPQIRAAIANGFVEDARSPSGVRCYGLTREGQRALTSAMNT